MRVALTYDRYDDDPKPLDVSMLRGTVVLAEYQVAGDRLALTYADGRTVWVRLHQCKYHSCDDTCMVVEDEQPA